uniref:Uncharacterized protein n=1 Tax=Schistocephalus solidus TaxID=70667 RepID=A0A0X3Q2L7_SCHSO
MEVVGLKNMWFGIFSVGIQKRKSLSDGMVGMSSSWQESVRSAGQCKPSNNGDSSLLVVAIAAGFFQGSPALSEKKACQVIVGLCMDRKHCSPMVGSCPCTVF